MLILKESVPITDIILDSLKLEIYKKYSKLISSLPYHKFLSDKICQYMGEIKNILKNVNEKQEVNNFPAFCVKTAEYLLTAKSILKNFSSKYQRIDEKYLDILIMQLNETKSLITEKREIYQILYTPFLQKSGKFEISPPYSREVKTIIL